MAKRGYKLQEFVAHASNVNCLNIGKKSTTLFLTGGNDRKVNLWAVGKTTPLLSLSGHTTPVESVTFDSTEGLVLAGSNNGTIKLWDLEEAKVVRTLTGHRSKCASLEFHPFGEFYASGSLDADLKIWDIRKKGCIHTYKGHTRGIRTIRFTPDGRWVVSGGEDNIVKVWDLTAGKLLHDFNFHKGVIRSIDFHPHEFLLATGSADRTVKFWDLETFELIGSAGPEGAGVRSMVFNPDGKTLFCGLDETLKVLSWEPVRCHDDVDIGWSTLGDLSIQEGKLLGCSYHRSSVGVWVADISLIGPYAGDAIPRSNDIIEPVFKPVNKYAVVQRKDSIKSFPNNLNKSTDQGSVVKEIIHTERVTSNDSCQKSLGKVGPAKVSKSNSRISTLLKGKKENLSLDDTQTFEEDSSSRSSTSILTLSWESRAMKSCPSTPISSEPNSMSKGTLLNSSRYSGSGLLNLKKKSTKMCTGTDMESTSTNVCLPLVIPRDDMQLQNTINCRKDTSTTEVDMKGTASNKLTHARMSSYGGGGSKSLLNATKSLNALDEVVDSNFLEGFMANSGIKDGDGRDQANNRPVAEKFERVVFLDRSFDSYKEKSLEMQNGSSSGSETHNSGSEIRPVKYVKGVAIQHGRTRSLVESWEKKDRFNNSCATESSLSSDATPQTDNLPLNKKEQNTGRGMGSEDDGFPGVTLQNRDLFINVLKSRLTKLQMVRHCWEQNGIKGTINAIAKLPDHGVQVDVISILVEKVDLFNLDLFSCSLPFLVGLLGGNIERHTDISMEMLLKLVKIFGPVIRSTLSASSPVGIDIEAEKRRKLCSQCFVVLEKLKEMLPPLIRRGGSLARHAMELNLALQQ